MDKENISKRQFAFDNMSNILISRKKKKLPQQILNEKHINVSVTIEPKYKLVYTKRETDNKIFFGHEWVIKIPQL